MTREKLENYIYLGKQIESIQKKIDYCEKNMPEVEHGKVKGSMREFPWCEVSFLVSGPDGFKSYDKWQKRINGLYHDYVNKKREAVAAKIEIEEFINSISDVSTQLMFTYVYIDGMTQEQTAEKLNIERSTISKRIKAYLND